ncbi:MAG TPA: hypothetical protein PLA50_15320, partial [Bacteroidia bacterium]|nr:hypothetical protein [Bacteroidia bacterium]
SSSEAMSLSISAVIAGSGVSWCSIGTSNCPIYIRLYPFHIRLAIVFKSFAFNGKSLSLAATT